MNDRRDRITEQTQREADAINAVRDGVRCGDLGRFLEGASRLDLVLFGWCRAMRAIARLDADFRRRMLQLWATNGDHLRGEVGDDLLLISALRTLLPAYRGPGLHLWRGDSARNRRRRTYGLSWSRQFEVADGFARGTWRTSDGGSVVVETDAPPEAVLCVEATATARAGRSPPTDGRTRDRTL